MIIILIKVIIIIIITTTSGGKALQKPVVAQLVSKFIRVLSFGI
jgi:hypothetical protein